MNVLVRCKIRRSAFSGEAIVEIPEAVGDDANEAGYTGISPVHYLHRGDLTPLKNGEPQNEVCGYVEARLRADHGPTCDIWTPDEEAVSVPRSIIGYVEKVVTTYIPFT